MSLARRIGLAIVFCWFFFGGIGHFFASAFFIGIVPPYIPWPVAAVYVSGVFEILGALGILHAPTRAAAGFGLFVLAICVTPANVHMWLHPELFPGFSKAGLTIRLLGQLPLLACIWWSTRPAAAPSPATALH